MINVSPGVHTPGRRPRCWPRRHSAFVWATSRRKFRADPAYPAACACGNNRFAEIRPNVFSTRSHHQVPHLVKVRDPGPPGPAADRSRAPQ